MNGRFGRARVLRRINRSWVERAAAAGVDTTDRVAVHAFIERERAAFYERLQREAVGQRRDA